MLCFVSSPKTFLFWEEISLTTFPQEVCFNTDLPAPFFLLFKENVSSLYNWPGSIFKRLSDTTNIP